jgi:hypothetical protein
MPVTRRIYVSLPADPWLPPNLNDLKWGIVEEIEKLGYLPEVFTNPRGKRGLASAKAWNARDADQIARHCVGAAIIGMGRWRFKDGDGNPVELPTEFNHYEGALAHTLGLPRLVLVQKNLLRRVVFDMNFSGYVGEFAADSNPDWLHTNEFRVPFLYWKRQLDEFGEINARPLHGGVRGEIRGTRWQQVGGCRELGNECAGDHLASAAGGGG